MVSNAKKDDVMQVFGSGIVSYFRIQHTLVVNFFLISVLFLPVFYIYHRGIMYEHVNSMELPILMLGNLGERIIEC